MKKTLSTFVDDSEVAHLHCFFFSLAAPENSPPIILHNDIQQAFSLWRAAHAELPPLPDAARFLRKIQEILLVEDRLLLMYRHRRGDCRLYQLNRDDPTLGSLSIKQFLSTKEQLFRHIPPHDNQPLEVNFAPFYDYGPAIRDPESIGNGVKHMNRYMAGKLSHDPEKWNENLYEFLKLHHLQREQLLLDGSRINSPTELEDALEEGLDYLERNSDVTDTAVIYSRLARIGFLRGWGDSRERIRETMTLLQDILEQQQDDALEEFLSRIPMVSSAAIISPHGWFAQDNVLGRPDTGGQVVYILDQVRALEAFLAADLIACGIDKIDPRVVVVTRLIPDADNTSCDQPEEKITGTDNATILRVPFYDKNGQEIRHWISRFHVWPYLDRFAVDVRQALVEYLGGRPDLIIGNYSDGNLVATRIAGSLGVIQCTIAHALEKPKYLFSNLLWEEFEDTYHFSIQFMADILAMNLTNFVVASSFQEITGTEDTIGQYESYHFFTMPDLLRVTSGFDLHHPKFNVIPPGADLGIYFPWYEAERRDQDETERLRGFLLHETGPEQLGVLDRPDLPAIFSMARLDRIKNISGLVEAYGNDPDLRKRANLVIIASHVDPSKSQDMEEKQEIEHLHRLIEQYNLSGSIRWIGGRLPRKDSGEIYRIIADMKGVFVQPALFEAFGLTIIEAMHCGLPVFATQFGGPQEIIENGISGFLINPTDHQAMTQAVAGFLAHSSRKPEFWQEYSSAAVQRALSRYTWQHYCRKLIRLTKVYGFWKFSTSHHAKSRLAQYCHVLYHLFVKARAQQMEPQ